MRAIPPSILERLQKNNQTKASNANPKMDILIRRARSGLTSTDLFYVETIRQEPELQDLEMLGIALERSDPEKAPFKAWNIYIQNGICKVATRGIPAKGKEKWIDVLTIGPAVECDITFDGQWVRDSKRRWNLITEGPPWIFWTTSAGNLYGQHWTTGDPLLLASGVDGKIAALRGWKNVHHWSHDQGIVAAYIKDGTVYYRTYARQYPDLPAIWESEEDLPDAPTPAQDVGIFRTNDYRTGFVVESEGDNYLGHSTRNWGGMAIEDHEISVGLTDYSIVVRPIEYTDAYETEHISVGLTEYTIFALWAMPENSFTSAENDGNTTVYATLEHYLTAVNPAEFEIRDTLNAAFSVTDIVVGANPKELTLTTDNLNFSEEGDLTLKFLGSGDTKGEAGQDVDPFQIVFTPQGLEYVVSDAPEVEDIYNE